MKTDLVRRAMAGDHEAFVAIVDEALPGLYGSAFHILRDAAAAEEAVQVAMIRAWRSVGELRDPERLDAWLYRLLVNACMDEGRRRSRVRLRQARLEAVAPQPRDDISDVSERDEVMAAMQRLTPQQRAVVVLVYYRGYSLAAAAEVLGAPVGTVKSRLHRALAELRSQLRPASPPETAGKAQA